MFRGPHTEKTKRHLSEIARNRKVEPPHPKGKDHPMYGKTHSVITRRKISEANKGKNVWRGLSKEKQDEIRRKISYANSGPRNGQWKGGKLINRDGYILLRKPTHPDANSTGYIFEHRLVMESVLGRRLESWETVHHINGKKADNNPSNLELWMIPQPFGQRLKDIIRYYEKHPLP